MWKHIINLDFGAFVATNAAEHIAGILNLHGHDTKHLNWQSLARGSLFQARKT